MANVFANGRLKAIFPFHSRNTIRRFYKNTTDGSKQQILNV